MNPTVTTPTEPTHMAIPVEGFREVYGLISEGTGLPGKLSFRLLTILHSATGANFNAPAPESVLDAPDRKPVSRDDLIREDAAMAAE